MTHQPTRASLLVRLRDPRDAEAWEQFVKIYTPMVFRAARRAGLQEADAGDIAQDVMQSVHRQMGTFVYDTAKGTFRGWLKTVTRSRIADWANGRKRHPAGRGGTDPMIQLAEHSSADDEEAWEKDYRLSLFDAGMDCIRKEFREVTVEAFWETAVKNRDPADVARELKISAGAVYIARSRITSRLREIIAVWERENT